mmetsp:Transcript_16294/g.25310  ORF Transcript_16294/g.25310 Transcript_16294/m.25310 type:complete len:203 (-) Transcript_16294:138-746(-)
MQEICDKAPHKNVIFGYKSSTLIKNVRLLATCLWSHVLPGFEEAVTKGITDYQVIKIEENGRTRRVTTNDTNRWHQDELNWLIGEIEGAKERGEKVVVMTHHAPTFHRTSHPRYTGNNIQSGFATDLEYLLTPPVTAWLYGHTHYNDPYFYQNKENDKETRVLISSNQMGYFAKGEKTSTFDTRYFISIGEKGATEERPPQK